MIDRQALLKDLQRQVKALEADLREQIDEVEAVGVRLRAEYARAFKLKRTAATEDAWLGERITQAAVAWVLGTVFVRFCEDNGLLGDRLFLAGTDKDRMTLAEEAQAQFHRDHRGAETDRGWLLKAFEEMSQAQAGKLLFHERHNPLYQIPVSQDAAMALIEFWRRRDEDGRLLHDFTDEGWDTRFLGDLYQDLSEAARKTYALLQTPEFVEEFILSRTLEPAINEFGHEAIRMIDPTCGSGHFLLGTFRRLLAEWERQAPGREVQERVRLALKSVHGVDINPFAVAIARFRLVVEALRAAGFRTLAETVGSKFPIKVAVGDALIKSRDVAIPGMEELGGTDELAEFAYATEDVHEYELLKENHYHVVVGNPPYILAKDRSLNDLYRGLYSACSGKYALSVPFAQRFFQLALKANKDGHQSGHVGQITSNSFMKREFGKKLISEYFKYSVDLTEVIDTSGAHIPGHGTPTIILIGRRRTHHFHGATIRTVLSIRGEPSLPSDPSKGKVWQSIISQIDHAGSEDEWVTVADTPRERLADHPWSLSGGGADELLETIQNNHKPLRHIASAGIFSVLGEEEAYELSRRSTSTTITLVNGDGVRDWGLAGSARYWPYDEETKIRKDAGTESDVWPRRRTVRGYVMFGRTKEDRGQHWTEYAILSSKRLQSRKLITWGEVSTHNHFSLSRGGCIFNQTSPVISLREESNSDQHFHLNLLEILNSSTACFYLKQISHDKGIRGEGGGITSEDWERFYQFNSTKIESLPFPSFAPSEEATQLMKGAIRLTETSPASVTTDGSLPTQEKLDEARIAYHSTRARMIALQEELDWRAYSLYGLLDDLRAPTASVPEIALGERAFEIVLARKRARGEIDTQWFARHNSTPITELPSHWPEAYKEIVNKRIEVIENNRYIGLIERPECKRRWSTEGWDAMQAKALRCWLLDRAESRDLWFHEVEGINQPRLLTTTDLANALQDDPDFLSVAQLYAPGKELTKLIAELVADEHVPYLAALRYKDSGLRKRADWEDVWDQQRAEDAAPTDAEKKAIRDNIPVPPKYTSADFLKPSYWRNRGKLDVPKERFISYPLASRSGDSDLLLGWAGWDHREQAQALATLIVEREQNEGWEAEQLAPLLAGLREVLPWVHQWHNEFDVVYGGSPADVYQGFLTEYTNRLHLTDEALATWRPPKRTKLAAKKS